MTKKMQGIGERKGMQSPLVQKKPKAGKENEASLFTSKDQTVKETPLPAGRFEERVRELEEEQEQRHYGIGEGYEIAGKLEGLKEGYSLGKQDMIREIEKKFARQGDEYQNVLVVNERDWQSLKKRELPQPPKGAD